MTSRNDFRQTVRSFVLILIGVLAAAGQQRFPPDPNIGSYVYPPYVTVESGVTRYTELLLDHVKEVLNISLSVSAVKTCNALFQTTVPEQSRIKDTDKTVNVQGSMDCLIEFWKFQPHEPGLTYDRFLEYFNTPAVTRACSNYTIVYRNRTQSQGGHSSASDGRLTVTNNPQVLCDSRSNVPFAVPITENAINSLTFYLDGDYLIYGILISVETIPLEVAVDLLYRGENKHVYKLQQHECSGIDEERGICQKWYNSELKEVALLWTIESDNIQDCRADSVNVRLSGTRFSDYQTNFHIIQSLKFLAKPM